MALTLADLLHEHWADYAQSHRSQLNRAHYRAVRRVLACRTPELGGRLYQCGSCKKHHYAYHSCNHRSCPQCGSIDQQTWSAKQEVKLLPIPYFLITFTIPSELRSLCLHRPKELYHLLLKCSATALHDVSATKLKTPGLRLGITSVLHTWGRQMQHHPHVHSIVPAVGYDPKNNQLIHPEKPGHFLVHYHPLADRFRSLIHTALKNDHPDIYQNLTPDQRRALSPQVKWNVQLQPAGRGKTALRYLARYIHRSALVPKRIIGFAPDGKLRLHHTPTGSKRPGIMKLIVFEFLRRWLLHVLPKGFARVRHYGYFASAAVKTRHRIRALLRCDPEPAIELPEKPPHTCDHCGGELTFLREIPRPRGPP